MFKNKSVQTHQFSMNPQAPVQRSSFRTQHVHKTTFDAGYLVPIYVDPVVPGDTFSVGITAFVRLATPIFPFMDNLHLETFAFFIPDRLLWTNFVRMMGEQDNPGDSIAFTVPQQQCPVDGYAVNSLQDYMGLPTVGQLATGEAILHNALPLRAYNRVYNDWFRDENLQSSAVVDTGAGPDTITNYVLRRRGKRHDYFTSALPSPQKGTAVSLPLGTTAPVVGIGTSDVAPTAGPVTVRETTGVTSFANYWTTDNAGGAGQGFIEASGTLPAIYADLSSATAATINAIRLAFQTQRFLERDARGGTRYTEIIVSHFGVRSPDARLQRSEYLGGGHSPVSINPVAQTSSTDATTPQGNLSAFGTSVLQHGFSQSFTEHGWIIILANVRADLTYQQGLRRFWRKTTRYDYLWPVFAGLGEQAILRSEIYVRGGSSDDVVFGYIPRFDEYRHFPSMITGLMKSTASGTIDAWHLAQEFATAPTLNSTFIQETPPMDRVLAVGEDALGQHFLADFFFDVKAARPLPMHGIPGGIDRF